MYAYIILCKIMSVLVLSCNEALNHHNNYYLISKHYRLIRIMANDDVILQDHEVDLKKVVNIYFKKIGSEIINMY